jgi:hypothetical protein
MSPTNTNKHQKCTILHWVHSIWIRVEHSQPLTYECYADMQSLYNTKYSKQRMPPGYIIITSITSTFICPTSAINLQTVLASRGIL